MPGARCTRGLVCKKSLETHTSIQGSGEHPTFPAQWFYGLCRALPGDEFVFASVAGGLKDCSDPVGSTLLRRLDTSNGCQDSRSLTDDKPALRPRHAPDAAASTATRPSFVTMANAPLGGTGWARDVVVIWEGCQGKFLVIGNLSEPKVGITLMWL
jgi:hypothetical protein